LVSIHEVRPSSQVAVHDIRLPVTGRFHYDIFFFFNGLRNLLQVVTGLPPVTFRLMELAAGIQ